MEAEGCLSTNLDSVDGLPSFHLNLVSNGKPLFLKPHTKCNTSSSSSTETSVRQLLDLVEPYVYNDLVPQVRQVGYPRIQVADIILRRYGRDCENA